MANRPATASQSCVDSSSDSTAKRTTGPVRNRARIRLQCSVRVSGSRFSKRAVSARRRVSVASAPNRSATSAARESGTAGPQQTTVTCRRSLSARAGAPQAATDWVSRGVFIIVAAFFWLTRRLFIIGRQAIALDRVFAGLMCQGVGLWMGAQSFINFGVNLGVLPTKGLTLPLLSYGGSGVVLNLVALALVLRVDMESRALMRGGRT